MIKPQGYFYNIVITVSINFVKQTALPPMLPGIRSTGCSFISQGSPIKLRFFFISRIKCVGISLR